MSGSKLGRKKTRLILNNCDTFLLQEKRERQEFLPKQDTLGLYELLGVFEKSVHLQILQNNVAYIFLQVEKNWTKVASKEIACQLQRNVDDPYVTHHRTSESPEVVLVTIISRLLQLT